MLTPFGKEVRKQRIERGMTLKNMADALSVSSGYLSAVETGQKNVSKKLVREVCSLLNLDYVEREQLERAADKSINDVKIHTKDTSEKARTAATVFARQFPDLNDQELDDILEVLNKKSRRGT